MASPIRIAQVMGKMNGGGVEVVVMNYFRHVERERVQFDFFVDCDSKLTPRDEIEGLGGRVIDVPRYQDVLSYQTELRRIFSDGGYRIVHSHLNTLSVFPLRAAKAAGVPIRIAHSHSTGGRGEFKKNMLKAALRPFSNVYPTHRMACSMHAGEWLFGKNVPFEVLYNAIDLDEFAFDAEARIRIRNSLGISEDQYVIGHVGRLTPVKNHDLLLKAFAKVCKRRDDCVLLCVGGGEMRPAFEQLADKLGISSRTHFLGHCDDVGPYYQAFDVFVLPSLNEGLGLAAIEAQRAGLPCLLSNQVPDEANVTGSVQFLPIERAEIWADAIDRAATHERNSVSSAAFADYDISQQAPRLQRLYETLLSTID